MQIILLDDVRALGRKGIVVDVPEGYARNFLFPQHLAVEASQKTLYEKQERENTQKSRVKKDEKQERHLAEQIDGLEVVIAARAEKGTLYAAVGPKDVAVALKEAGYKVNPDFIEMDPIKDICTSEVTVNFPSGFEAVISVAVEGK